ncbi:hypothetical protein [Azospirillum rugosum]|uniref:Uncharacterized protein n=1 Tax=Azospirillum rugosum TaxID=416170 RepID=A0ABS4SFM8_9PROT|nr:hypothetical protein [Azospirillum rugosum]MBP2290752.1 hypothetical protein [Azospirillum rugosum]MDQ0525641.1 hypothetical protein [Azospirillum rugosum]
MRDRIAAEGLSAGGRNEAGLSHSTIAASLPGRAADSQCASGEDGDPFGIGPAPFGLRAALAVLALPMLMLILTALAVMLGG